MGNLLEIDNLISKDKKLNNICEKIVSSIEKSLQKKN